MTRRDFVKSAVGGIAAATFSPSLGSAALEPMRRETTPKRIVVIGAGLAGLAAAYELHRAGHNVTVLEARDAAGGRVRTLRAPLDDELHAELGGQQYYPVNPNYAAHYADEFGLKRETGGARGLVGLNYLGNRIIRPRTDEPTAWPLSLTDEEQRLGLAAIRRKYLEPALDELASLIGPTGWSAEAVAQFDAISFGELLRSRGASPAAVDLLRVQDRDYVGEVADHYSALDMLGQLYNVRAASRYLTKEPFFSIAGGNDLLPRAFAARLGDRIVVSAAVSRIEHTGDRVVVRYTREGRDEKATADFAVCAIPFSVLRSLEVSPSFSTGKMRAIRELSYASVARTYVQCREKFWRAEGLSGSATTDLPTTYFWESTDRQSGTRGVLQGWIMGSHAGRFQASNDSGRKAFALAQARQVFPRVDDFVEKAAWISWQEEPWARGAYAWLRPGDGKALWPHLATPEGRIHFAGDHTSTWFLHSSMQGALESGIRAAKAINEIPS